MRAASSTMIRWGVRCCSHIIGAQSDFMGTNAMSQDTRTGQKQQDSAGDPCARGADSSPARGRAITSSSSIKTSNSSTVLSAASPQPPWPMVRASSWCRRLRIGRHSGLDSRPRAWTSRRATDCGQLTVVDADELLPQFMREAMPDAPVFLGLAADVIAQARGGDRYPKVRWWGEMVNVLWERGDVAASMQLEDQFHHLAHDHDIAIFCSFVMDNFNGDVHSRMLPRLGQNHSHLIPVEDYARLERAVADALRETVGSDEARVLEEQLLPQVSVAVSDAAIAGLALGAA